MTIRRSTLDYSTLSSVCVSNIANDPTNKLAKRIANSLASDNADKDRRGLGKRLVNRLYRALMLPTRRVTLILVIIIPFVLKDLLAVLLNLFICCLSIDPSVHLLAYPSTRLPIFLSTYRHERRNQKQAVLLKTNQTAGSRARDRIENERRGREQRRQPSLSPRLVRLN